MRVLVTGAAGFIGSHLCESLLARDCDVVGVDNFITGSRENLGPVERHPRFRFIEQDVSEYIRVDGPLDWIQVFVRTSAELAAVVEPLLASLSPTGLAWISYPKGSSKMQTDLTRDKGWEPLEGSDLMWLTLVSIDDTWSAFGMRPYKPGEARQTFR